jgi:shikimate kinase
LKNIYLIGYMGSGKSTLGHEFARRIRCRFIDTDQQLERDHQLSIPEIFKQFGEEQFRKWETDLLILISKEENLVVATGGGLPCFQNNMELLNNSGITIYLKLSNEAIFDRLSRRRETRPLISNYNDEELKQYIQTSLNNREPFYLQAHHIVNAGLISVHDLLVFTSPS